jgi:phage/plasmid-like protein (TIGR03299 family)
MGHNIEHSSNGSDSFFSVRQPAWHGLRQIIDAHPTIEEALVYMNGNYNVIKVPVEHSGVEVEGFYKTVRSDTDKCLGVVGERYTVISNKDAFEIIDMMGGEGVKRETGGVLGKGERVFMTAIMPETCKIAGDVIGQYFVLTNSFDGSSSLRMMMTPVRVVCQNTLNMAINGATRTYLLKHTENYERRLQEAAKSLGIIKDYYTRFKDIGEALVAQKFNEKNFFDLMDTLMPVPDDASKRALTIYEREREKITSAYYVPDLNNIRETKWGAYNAIADYSDHARESRGDNADANKFIRTFEATDLKDRAFVLLTAK